MHVSTPDEENNVSDLFRNLGPALLQYLRFMQIQLLHPGAVLHSDIKHRVPKPERMGTRGQQIPHDVFPASVESHERLVFVARDPKQHVVLEPRYRFERHGLPSIKEDRLIP
jgi:hypothetical protein